MDKRHFFVAISCRHDDVLIDEGSFQHLSKDGVDRQFSGMLYMGPVFDEVFSYSYELALPEGLNTACKLDLREIDISQNIIVNRVLFLISKAELLGKTEPDDHFLILDLTHADEGDRPRLKSQGLNDREIVKAYLDAIAHIEGFDKMGQVLQVFRTAHPGLLYSNDTISDNPKAEHVKPYLFAFYYYAHLISWRLERSQTHLKLETMELPTSKLIEDLSIQRLRIINLLRYFQTKNRSSNPIITEFCKQRIQAHHIQERYSHFHNSLVQFETYIGTLNAIAQTRGSHAVKKTLNTLAFFAIPLGIFGAIMQLSPNTDIIKIPDQVLTNKDIWFWLMFSFLSPLILLGIGYLYDRHITRKQ